MERRHIRLEGCFNLRDLGGYQTTDGRRVRTGCLFRSDELHALTGADLEAVTRLGIRVVFDLRSADERAVRPSRLPAQVELLERITPSTTGAPLALEEQIASGTLPLPDDTEFAAVYVRLIEMLAPEVRTVLERAVDAPTRPLLFHCAGGKDRTGIVAAVLLGVLGVPDEVILDDYELTSRYLTPGRMNAIAPVLEEYGVPHDRVRPLLEARRPVLASAIEHIRTRWGGFDGYAREHLGVDGDLPSRLQAALLVDPVP